MKSFAAALLLVAANAGGYDDTMTVRARFGPTKENADFQHDRVWGHGHYEPGDIERFDNHYAEIYGADDLAWGPNGFQNPHTHNDDHHNWDDQGDAFVCHGCGGHGCELCAGYGHQHRNAAFGNHGHTLKTGFGNGHSHAYLGDKPRSSYNKYGHGVGGRYSQRWSNGYGGRYGLGHGHRYGLAHRWSSYNGYGHGNPSSKGSVMGYGIGANAQIPMQWEISNYDDANYSPWGNRGGVKDYPDHLDRDQGYGNDDYGYEQDYDYDTYEEPEYEDDYKRGMAMRKKASYGKGYKPSYDSNDYYIDFAKGYGSFDKFSQGSSVGKGHAYDMEFGHGHGNHSPWNSEVYRHDAGVMGSYRFRPKKQAQYHTTPGYGKNEWF